MNFVDGVNCINIYSKGKTELGRALSNMANIPITGKGVDGTTHVFASVEAWWYWYVTGKKYHQLKILHGFAAKEEGRKLPRVANVTPEMFRQVAITKLQQHESLFWGFINNMLSYAHYYEYGGKIVPPKNDITADVWNAIHADVLNGRLKIW